MERKHFFINELSHVFFWKDEQTTLNPKILINSSWSDLFKIGIRPSLWCILTPKYLHIAIGKAVR